MAYDAAIWIDGSIFRRFVEPLSDIVDFFMLVNSQNQVWAIDYLAHRHI